MHRPRRGPVLCEAGTGQHAALKPYLFRDRWLCPYHALGAIADALRAGEVIEALPLEQVHLRERQRRAAVRRAPSAGVRILRIAGKESA